MLKKMLIMAASYAALTTSSIAATDSLKTYDQISNVLETGKMVMVSIDVNKCDVTSDSVHPIKRLAIRFSDLYEFETTFLGKKMRAIGSQETGLFGRQKFNWTRNLVLIFEDNTVVVLDDEVDPSTFNLTSRAMIKCKLSADNSGGASAKLAG